MREFVSCNSRHGIAGNGGNESEQHHGRRHEMKKWHLILAVGLTTGILFLAFGFSGNHNERSEKEVKVSVSDLPDVVKATLEKEVSGGTIGKIEKEEKDGKVVYEVDFKIEGKEFELKIADDGTVLKKEAEEEKEEKEGEERDKEDRDEAVTVALNDLPQAVQDTVTNEAKGGEIGEIEKEEEGGKVVYDVDVKIEGKKFELKIADDGTLLKKKADEDKDGDEEDDDNGRDEE
jgi:uncharacterized membrane protein YkoI